MDDYSVDASGMEDWVRVFASSWDNPFGELMAEITERVTDEARAMAPVSARGSKYAPSGFLKSSIRSAYQHEADGSILGLAGVPLRRGRPYPFSFVNSASGTRLIRNQYSAGAKWANGRHGHSYGEMGAKNVFLETALYTVGTMF